MEQQDVRIARNRIRCELCTKQSRHDALAWMGVSMIVSPKRISSEENNGRDSDRRIAIHGITRLHACLDQHGNVSGR